MIAFLPFFVNYFLIIGTGLFHEGFQTASFIMTPLSVGLESRQLAAFTAFLSFQLPIPGKKAQNIPSILFTLFFKSCILIFISIKTIDSVEDIVLSQNRVIAENNPRKNAISIIFNYSS